MAPTVHLVRHAQGYHNLSIANHVLPDPDLTPKGIAQCEALHSSFPYHSQVTHVVASPIRRTIYTALIGFSSAIESNNLRVTALPELQEVSDTPCDTGSPPEKIKAEFADKPVDLSLVPEGWDSKTGKWSPEADAVRARSAEARRFLQKLGGDGHIVVTTHGGVLHFLTEDWEGFVEDNGTGWANTEWRSYTFDEKSGDNASLIETLESKQRRAGEEKPMTEAEKRNVQEAKEA